MSGTLNGYYAPKHRSQYAVGSTQITRRAGCTWTSVSTGADAATGGVISKTPDQVHALVRPEEETSPATPGWSLEDAQKAAARMGLRLDIRSGQGWAGVEGALDDGLYVVLQGDSDQLASGCSGDFDGDHCIGVHPAKRMLLGKPQHWIDDPICPTGRWEFDSVLRRYAEKFSPSIRFAVFTKPVPRSSYVVSITGYTPLYASAGGSRALGPTGKPLAARLATYICTRTKADGLWWYGIVSKVGGGSTKNSGKWFKPNRHVKAVPA